MELLPTQEKEVMMKMREKPIRDFDADDFKSLHILLLKWAKFLGIKEAPDEEQIVMLIIFLREHFNNFTLSMVKDAFNLAIARKLPNIDPEHYQNFSPVYVSGILKAYYDYTERARKAFISASKKAEANEFKISKEDAEKEMPMLVRSCIEDPSKIGISGEVVYDYLVELELLSLTYDEKIEIMKRAKEQVKSDILSEKKGEKNIKNLIQSIEAHPKKKNQKVIVMSKKMGLSIHLDKLGDKGRGELLQQVQKKSDERLKIMRERRGES
jgi:hypothetical protein